MYSYYAKSDPRSNQTKSPCKLEPKVVMSKVEVIEQSGGDEQSGGTKITFIDGELYVR